jgi:hypothetical protein
MYRPRTDPSDLFESMNIHGWIKQREDQSTPLTDGATAQLMLSDENGSYVMPPHNTTHVLYGPFSRDAGATKTWGEIKAHSRSPLVLLSDSNTTTMLCHYPTPAGLNQLLPSWAMSPSLGHVTRNSAVDVALAQPWPAPAVRPLSKPKPDMVAFYRSSSAKGTLDQYEALWKLISRRELGDREFRFMFWYVVFNQAFPNTVVIRNDGAAQKVMDVFYTAEQKKALSDRFSGLRTSWDFRPVDVQDTSFNVDFCSVNPPVSFDPPYIWKTKPGQPLFHQSPPAWYDPWGYNRPGDFVTTPQPTGTYLDPFCFNGHLKFPQRPVTLETGFKGNQWAVFTDNDPSSVQTSTDRESADAAPPNSDPSILVIRTDEDKQQTVLYVLFSKRLIVTYDAPSHELHPEWLPYGLTGEQILGCPTVFYDAAKVYPAAWCPGSKEYPAARLRKIAALDPSKGKSLWDTFVDQNKTQYGPSPTETAWKIGECPLPADALPGIVLYGYLLPAPK